ncbi:MAG TPA: Rpn family recombination-promoting nuclease/putative transposase [Blastocatellia bacterium]|nr:Rpn family recombination-promoting nuclease/putative transposase [Blastocatellia bacterium]
MTTEITNPHDKFFKEAFGRADIAAEFMAHYLPSEVVAALDLTAPELVKDSFIDKSLQEHFSDLLYKVKLRDTKTAAYIFLLFEHKSVPDAWAALQILRYLLEVWEQLQREGVKKLPPIFPLVFYHGNSKWRVPVRFNALVDFSAREYLKPYVPEYQYFLCDLSQLDDSQLSGDSVLQTVMLMMKNIRRRHLRTQLRSVITKLAQQPSDFFQACVTYIANAAEYVRRNDLQTVLRDVLTGKRGEEFMPTIAQEFRQEGRQEGRQEEAAKNVLRLLQRRLGNPPATQQDFIRTLPLEQLETLFDASFDFTSITDLNNWLATHTTNK